MTRTVHEIADDLATAQKFVEAAEEKHGEACRAVTDAGFKLTDAKILADRLRLELKDALRAAGDVWPNHGEEVRPAMSGKATHLGGDDDLKGADHA